MRGFKRWFILAFAVGVGAGVLGPAWWHGAGAQERAEGLPAPGEPWDLVYMTDSTGCGVAAFYAEHAEEALGVEVRSHDLTRGGLSATRLLELLDDPSYAQKVAEAEIIVVFGNPRDSGAELPEPDIETCVSTLAYVRPPPAPSDAADWAPYREVLGRVFDRVWDLREGRPTIFRAVDMYAPVLAQWTEAGILPECTREWTMMSDQVRASAEAHGVRMVSVFDALNGPQHDRDIVQLGWIGADGEHLNLEGAAQVADALAEAGFTPLESPPSQR